MEKGRLGLLCVKDGGSTRRKGELEARRFEMAWRRLFFGEPRLLEIGVDLAVFGDESALRTDGTEGVALRLLAVGLVGEVKMENLAGLMYPASLLLAVLDFLVGLLKMDGSMFSESASSKISGARWRLPVDGVGIDFTPCGDAKFGERAVAHAFSECNGTWSEAIYHFACSSRSEGPGDVTSRARQRAGA
jgi:hypothetical protein